MKIRLLRENEIECRVGTINEKGLTILIYKDARVDMNILDEAVGVSNWQRKHYELKNHIYCSVGVKAECVEDGGSTSDEWVWKDDVGTESNTEATKGESSDSFKRACFNWGIGRELYSAPFIWVASDKYSVTTNKKTGKPTTYDKFRVEKIKYNDDREIIGLAIKNSSKNNRVFLWQKEETND
jgi:hypothetical protein